MTIKLRCINKIIVKIKNLHKKLFSYPSFRYEKVLQNKYWQKRKNNSLVIQPNDFQLERARLVSQIFIVIMYCYLILKWRWIASSCYKKYISKIKNIFLIMTLMLSNCLKVKI